MAIDKKFILKFGKHLREVRIRKGLSQEEIAYNADIPINQIGRIERGEINTGISTVNAIAKVLDIHPKELFDF